MPYYHIVFVNNKIVSCIKTAVPTLYDKAIRYEHNNSRLTYAIVKADTNAEARKMAKQLTRELKIS